MHITIIIKELLKLMMRVSNLSKRSIATPFNKIQSIRDCHKVLLDSGQNTFN